MPKLRKDLYLVSIHVPKRFGVPTYPNRTARANFLFYTVNVPLYKYVPYYEYFENVPVYEYVLLYEFVPLYELDALLVPEAST